MPTNRPLHPCSRLRATTVTLVALTIVVLSLSIASIAGAASETNGFIHGTVRTEKGQTFSGFLRWDNEEAFWGDLFNSSKEETPFLDSYGKKGKGSRREFEVFGRKINIDWGGSSTGRQFVARFGDIQSIDAKGDDRAVLHMKDGSTVKVKGSSNDVDATIKIRDAEMGNIEVDWKKIDTITFSASPAAAEAWGTRLHGTVETNGETFTGFVQWDKQECISIDKLDGESDDINVSLAMGNIRSIKRDGRRASIVVLRDGRTMRVSGSNDVNSENRGVLVEDDSFGRVEIPWMAFSQVTFDEVESSGPSYPAYRSSGLNRGTATTVKGEKLSGQIIYDLDETHDWEMLDGDLNDVSYSIPFMLIESIRPLNSRAAEVTLRTGKRLTLSEGQDVSEDNDGILVINDEKETYIAWEDVQLLAFEK